MKKIVPARRDAAQRRPSAGEQKIVPLPLKYAPPVTDELPADEHLEVRAEKEGGAGWSNDRVAQRLSVRRPPHPPRLLKVAGPLAEREIFPTAPGEHGQERG